MASRRKLVVAIVLGVVLAGPPVAALNFWLSDMAERQVQDELDHGARRAMALAEIHLARTAAVLDDLAARGADNCRPSTIDMLRQGTFGTTPVKELSIVAADGRMLCADTGNPREARTVTASEAVGTDGGKVLDVVRIADRPGSWVRLRRPGTAAANDIAALIPAELLAPHPSDRGDALDIHIRLTTRGGALVTEAVAGTPEPAQARDRLVAVRASRLYPLQLTVSASRSMLPASQRDLRILGSVTSGLIAILILLLAVLLPRRERENPIADIERALKAGEFVPYYQPIVDIRTGRLRGAEVLVRWRKPDGSVVSPAAFIPLAESSGLIIELTRTLMRRVCQEAGEALGKRPHIRIGFNLTARHFADEEIVEDIRKIFKKSMLRPSQIVLEVTERQPLENLTETRRVVAALQGLGVRIAIDDVGTGHSGLSYMLKLGVDIIKIDKMFIDSIGTDRNSNAIIETLIDLAQNMRMEVIAEGVESFEQVVHLRELGVRAAQGFVFAPPLPGPVFLQLVEAIDPLKQGDEGGSEAAGSGILFAHSDAA